MIEFFLFLYTVIVKCLGFSPSQRLLAEKHISLSCADRNTVTARILRIITICGLVCKNNGVFDKARVSSQELRVESGDGSGGVARIKGKCMEGKI